MQLNNFKICVEGLITPKDIICMTLLAKEEEREYRIINFCIIQKFSWYKLKLDYLELIH